MLQKAQTKLRQTRQNRAYDVKGPKVLENSAKRVEIPQRRAGEFAAYWEGTASCSTAEERDGGGGEKGPGPKPQGMGDCVGCGALKKMAPWKSPGPHCIAAYWLKQFRRTVAILRNG